MCQPCWSPCAKRMRATASSDKRGGVHARCARRRKDESFATGSPSHPPAEDHVWIKEFTDRGRFRLSDPMLTAGRLPNLVVLSGVHDNDAVWAEPSLPTKPKRDSVALTPE